MKQIIFLKLSFFMTSFFLISLFSQKALSQCVKPLQGLSGSIASVDWLEVVEIEGSINPEKSTASVDRVEAVDERKGSFLDEKSAEVVVVDLTAFLEIYNQMNPIKGLTVEGGEELNLILKVLVEEGIFTDYSQFPLMRHIALIMVRKGVTADELRMSIEEEHDIAFSTE